MSTVYLYGAGGHAKVIADILSENGVNVPVIYDNNTTITKLLDIPVEHVNLKSPIIISIGNNSTRKKIVEGFSIMQYAKAIAKTAIISTTCKIDQGTVVMQGVILQASTSVGQHVIINTGSTIDHDCIIHDYVHIAPGVNLCGDVEVGEGSLIGVGSVVIPGVKIGKWCTVGAGSVVTKNIPDYTLVVGNPARIINKNTNYEQQ